jgi:hypothetical protein
MYDIKVGDIVRLNKNCFFYKQGNRFTAAVKRIDIWEGEITPENHGSIEVEMITTESYYLSPGELEHFTYYEWEKYLEVVKEV